MEKQLKVQETLLEPIELDDAELDSVAGGISNSFNGNTNSLNGNTNSFNNNT